MEILVALALALVACAPGADGTTPNDASDAATSDVQSGSMTGTVTGRDGNWNDGGVRAPSSLTARGVTPDSITPIAGYATYPGQFSYSEPSITYVPAYGRYVVAFNDGTGGSQAGWSYGTNLGSMTHCNATTAGCGPSADAGVPMAPYDSFIGGQQTAWASDANVVTAGNKVVYVTMGNAAGYLQNVVVASVSLDGGAHFVRTSFVNNTNVGCYGGYIDQPSATADSNGAVWIAWRHSGSGGFGLCVRGGTVNADGTFSWYNGGSVVQGVIHDFARGVGGVEIASDPADGEIGLAYTFTDEYAQGPCPNQTVNMAYIFQRATNLGTTWSAAEQIVSYNSWPTCLDDVHHENTSGRGTLGFVFDPTTKNYVMAFHRSLHSIDVWSRPSGNAMPHALRFTYASATNVLHPVLATDNIGHFGLGFYQTDGLGNLAFMTMGAMNLTTWQGPAYDSYPFAPNPANNSNFIRVLSDNQGLTMGPGTSTSATIVAAWTDLSQTPPAPLTVPPANEVWVNTLNLN